LPPSVQDWLPERYLARYEVEVVEEAGSERARADLPGTAAHPSLLIDGYATGCFSSRKIERARD